MYLSQGRHIEPLQWEITQVIIMMCFRSQGLCVLCLPQSLGTAGVNGTKPTLMSSINALLFLVNVCCDKDLSFCVCVHSISVKFFLVRINYFHGL